MRKVYFIRIVVLAALFVSVFFVPGKSRADLSLPATPCDDTQTDAILPGFGTSAHVAFLLVPLYC